MAIDYPIHGRASLSPDTRAQSVLTVTLSLRLETRNRMQTLKVCFTLINQKATMGKQGNDLRTQRTQYVAPCYSQTISHKDKGKVQDLTRNSIKATGDN